MAKPITIKNNNIRTRFAAMKSRCSNPKDASYPYYGGEGIKVCKEWINNPVLFEVWALANGFSKDLTIDRKDSKLNYSPSNCRWVDRSTQTQNTRKLYRHNTSGFRGVTVRGSKFQARIKVEGKQLHLGMHETAEEAAIAYDEYVVANKLEHTLNSRKEVSNG